jgi:hypothetical protein
MCQKEDMMERKYFTRVLTPESIEIIRLMLCQAADDEITIDLTGETFEVKAPDGDVVLAGLKKDRVWICRMHREVFAE